MKLFLVTHHGVEDKKLIATNENLELLLDIGSETAKELGDDLPTWTDGSAVDAIIGNSSSHFLLLPSGDYLHIQK